MPAFKTQPHFPGVDRIPGGMQRLLESIFPPDSLPIPMMGGEMTPPGGPGMKAMVWRGVDDMKKVMPQGSAIPPPPNTAGQVGSAFDEYLKKVADLLRQKGSK